MSVSDADGGISAGGLGLARKTVVVVDLVESVALMERREMDVIDRWRRFVSMVRAEVLPRHGGRMVKHLGDGMLCVFDGTRQAVASALELHRTIERVDAAAAGQDAMRLRVGIHIGDVVVDELDVLGRGVNLAARLAGLAGPGETVCSIDVRDDLIDSFDVTVQDLGDCYLKHVEAPCRAFRVGPAAASTPPDRSLHDRRPGIAVVPFEVRSVRPEDAVLGDALADEILAGLAATRLLRVISRLSTRAFAGTAVAAPAIGHALGVTYVVGGRCVVTPAKLRVYVEMIDTRSDAVAWSSSVTMTADDVLDPGHQAVDEIVARIGLVALAQEVARARALPFHALDDYSLFIGGIGLMNRLSRHDFDRSFELFGHLAERLPRNPAPRAMNARWHVMRMMQGWSPDPAAEALQARAHARRAIAIDPGESHALAVDALVGAHVDDDLDSARARALEATDAGPQDAYAWLVRSGIHSYLGEGPAADEAAAMAWSLSPLDPARFQYAAYRAMAKLLVGDFASAVEWAEQSLRLNRMFTGPMRIKCIAQVLWGRGDDASRTMQEMQAIQPGYTVAEYLRRYPGRSSPHAAQFASALRTCGLPA